MILDDEGGGLKNYTTKIIFFFTKYINFPQFRELNLLKNGQTYMGKILLKKRGGGILLWENIQSRCKW